MINKAIIIGGSAGSLQVLLRVLEDCPAHFEHPIIIVVHRGKNKNNPLPDLLAKHSKRPVYEVEHYQQLENGKVYLAPANYHLLLGSDLHFELDLSERVLFSRPSIDVSFASSANALQDKLIGVVVSGANKDCAAGANQILQNGGVVIVQDPNDADVDTMPNETLAANPTIEHVVPANQIMKTLLTLTTLDYEPK